MKTVLSLSLSLLLVGDIRNAMPQQGQNEPLWKKYTSQRLQYFFPPS
jgi:hypothetical protein